MTSQSWATFTIMLDIQSRILATATSRSRFGVEMPANPKPENHAVPVSSPYCSDPNCAYCKELREVQAEIRTKNEQGGGSALDDEGHLPKG